MTTKLDALTAPFAEEELRHFEGRGGKQMTFIEDETVMDRLDAAFGVGGWQVNVEPIPYVDGVVKVRLGVRIARTLPESPGSEWTWYEDFGYPNQTSGDMLKEAVSDGIRRCGRYLGIARDLYRKRTYEAAPRPVAAQSPAHPIAAAPRSTTALPDDEGVDWDSLNTAPPRPIRPTVPLSEGEGLCPAHGVPWALKPAGTSKSTGKDYGPFFTCGASGPPWCTEKPTKQWVEAHHP